MGNSAAVGGAPDQAGQCGRLRRVVELPAAAERADPAPCLGRHPARPNFTSGPLNADRRRRDGSRPCRRPRAASNAKHTTSRSLLLTRPDAPRGRGRRLAAPPAKEAAERLGIPVFQPERPELPDEPIDAIVVCAYGLYIPPPLLDRALWLNVHPSLLPRWRGAAPVERAILAGDE